MKPLHQMTTDLKSGKVLIGRRMGSHGVYLQTLYG